MYTQKEVLDFVTEEDVKFIRLVFFDPAGNQKNISIMAGELPRAFSEGISFDASAIEGFETPDKSDLFLHPEPSTLSVIPWRPATGKVVKMFCDIKTVDGTPYKKDCRQILKNAVKKAKEEYGVKFNFGSEMEFYLFKLDENGNPTDIPFDNAGYLDIAPVDKGENIRREICFTLEQMGIHPEASLHEEGPGQNEIDFHYSDALTAADNTSTFKWIVRTKAAANGLFADFSPKPLSDKPGSGMHINISCEKLGECESVCDPSTISEKNPLGNELMSQCLAGILAHIEEITYYLNPTKKSYHRIGECKAPQYISWGRANRSELIRIPATKNDIRIELRSPDCTCNPYIAYTLLIYAALDGIKNKLVPPAENHENLFAVDPTAASKFKKIPETLSAAQKAADCEFIKQIFR
jgi:glutamine synthetase